MCLWLRTVNAPVLFRLYICSIRFSGGQWLRGNVVTVGVVAVLSTSNVSVLSVLSSQLFGSKMFRAPVSSGSACSLVVVVAIVVAIDVVCRAINVGLFFFVVCSHYRNGGSGEHRWRCRSLL